MREEKRRNIKQKMNENADIESGNINRESRANEIFDWY